MIKEKPQSASAWQLAPIEMRVSEEATIPLTCGHIPMQARGLSPHEGVEGLWVVVGCGRTVVRVVGGATVVPRSVFVVVGRRVVMMVVGRRVVMMVVGAVPVAAHLPDRQIRSPSQSFSVSHGSPEAKPLRQLLHRALADATSSVSTYQCSVQSTRIWDWRMLSA